MQTAYFRFGQLRQDRGEKHVRAGELVTATNVRQTSKAGVYQKRRGFSMTTMAFSGATWGSATVSSCVSAKDGVGMLMRDSQDRVWAYDGAAASPTWAYRGAQARAWADSTTINPGTYANPMPCSVDVGTNIWTFARRGTFVAGNYCKYDLVIADKTTGAISFTLKDVDAPGSASVNGIINMCACYDGTYVWVFFVVQDTADNKVYCHKYTAASPSNPVATTFHTGAAGAVFQHVACLYVAASNTVLVAFGGLYNGKAWLYHAKLNTATGASASAQLIFNQATAVPVQALGFLPGSGGDDSIAYYHYYGFQVGGSGVTFAGPVLVEVTVSTAAYTLHNYDPHTMTVTDVVAGTGIRYQYDPNDGGGSRDFQLMLFTKNGSYMASAIGLHVKGGYPGGYTWDNGLTGVNHWTNSFSGCWLASGLSQVGNYFYFLTGFDDIAESAIPTGTALVSVSTQRTYHLRRISVGSPSTYLALAQSFPWTIVAHVSNGLAGARYHNATLTTLNAYRNTALDPLPVVRVPALFANGNTLIATAAADAGVTGSVGISRLTFTLDKQWGKDCQAMGKAIGPGSIPVVWSKQDNAHEIAPLLAPPFVYKSASAGASEYATLAVVYNIRDADGTVWRSAPYLYTTAFGVGSVFQIPSLRHLLPGTSANIEIYLGTTATPKLQAVVPNLYESPAGSGIWTQTYAYTIPSVASLVDGEVLYTIGKGLSQAWPPQCQSVGQWRNRVFLGSKNVLWYSQEFSEGIGLIFNEVLRSMWSESATDINVIKAIDWNYLALLASGGAAVIDGPGPDSLGSGAYTIRTLSTHVGASISASVLSGYNGCYFQDANTGRPVSITPQLQAQECAAGAYDYAGETVSAAWYNESERQLVFFTSSGKALVIDYQHPTESAPFGQVYMWTPAVTAFAASEDAAGVYYVSTGGNIHRPSALFQDTSLLGAATDYRMVIKTAPLQVSDLQGAFDVSKIQVLGSFVANCSARMLTFPDYAAAGTASGTLAFTAEPLQFMTMPPACMRIQAVAVQIEETAGIGAAFNFEGLAMQYMPRPGMKRVNTSQVVA